MVREAIDQCVVGVDGHRVERLIPQRVPVNEVEKSMSVNTPSGTAAHVLPAADGADVGVAHGADANRAFQAAVVGTMAP